MIDGIQYHMGSKDFKDIHFPIIFPETRGAFYIPSHKVVYLPIRYQFRNKKKDKVVLTARMILPDDYPKLEAMTMFPERELFQLLLFSYKEKRGVWNQFSVRKEMSTLSSQLYHKLMETGKDFIMLEKSYDYPAFLLSGKEVIGIGNTTVFHYSDDKVLTLSADSMTGTYLSKQDPQQLSLLIFSEEGQPIVLTGIHDLKADGNRIKAVADGCFRNEYLVTLCRDIISRYKGNYIHYFMDKEQGKGSDIFEFFA